MKGQIEISIVLIVRDPSESPEKVFDALCRQKNAETVMTTTEFLVIDGRPKVTDYPLPSKFEYCSLTLAPQNNMPRLKAIGLEKIARRVGCIFGT